MRHAYGALPDQYATLRGEGPTVVAARIEMNDRGKATMVNSEQPAPTETTGATAAVRTP